MDEIIQVKLTSVHSCSHGEIIRIVVRDLKGLVDDREAVIPVLERIVDSLVSFLCKQ